MRSHSAIDTATARRCRGLLRLAENSAEALAISSETTTGRRRKRTFRRGGNVRLAGRVCFVITETGHSLTRRFCAVAARGVAPAHDKPEWNATTGVLSFSKIHVLHIERGDVELSIVQRFDVLDWPSLMDDPVIPYPGNHAHRRTNALNRLNARQNPCRLRFFSVVGFAKMGWFPLKVESDASGGG